MKDEPERGDSGSSFILHPSSFRLHPFPFPRVPCFRASVSMREGPTSCGPGQSVALLGSSGVGKSTLANTLGAGDFATGGLATGGIREQDGKGRHTTTSRSLHLLPTGGVLVDNPGVREFHLRECDEGVADLFEDVVALIAGCRFSDCHHAGEPGC
ncbi:Probable GTPase related to EngC, partial [hydrothermal vent metagenome]